LPASHPDAVHAWHHYTIRCRSPKGVREALEAEGIEWKHYYPSPACSQPALGDARLPPGSFPEAERACAEAISIPIRSTCSPSAIRQIAGVIRRALGT
jgi:dTDP-4-amino-4,6-dideoxygalactose transaminase